MRSSSRSERRGTFDKRSLALVWPLLGLLGLLLINALLNPGFFHLEIMDGRVTGSLIDIVDRGAPVLLLSLGMTLVIATAGIDLSVGSVMAMSGSLAAVLLVEQEWPLALAILAALVVCTVAGAWNGLLVSRLKVQPIVATLVLMVAGRGVAQLLTDGQIITLGREEGFAFLGGGHFLGLPFPTTIVVASFLIVVALTRWTALGLFIEAVGANETASSFAGLSVGSLKIGVYALSGLLAGVAGLIYASDITAADANNAGLYLELDAILAVVIGGASLSGGRFRLLGTAIGALTIQTLTTTLLMIRIGGREIPPEYSLIVKAAVVLAVCVVQTDKLRAMLRRRQR
ncbi:MAG: ABC transporter permease [Planctomycetota bacterium]